MFYTVVDVIIVVWKFVSRFLFRLKVGKLCISLAVICLLALPIFTVVVLHNQHNKDLRAKVNGSGTIRGTKNKGVWIKTTKEPILENVDANVSNDIVSNHVAEKMSIFNNVSGIHALPNELHEYIKTPNQEGPPRHHDSPPRGQLQSAHIARKDNRRAEHFKNRPIIAIDTSPIAIQSELSGVKGQYQNYTHNYTNK
jgi:hypothetical protein